MPTQLLGARTAAVSASTTRGQPAPPPGWLSFQSCIRFTSIDPERNRHRYYELRWEPSIFGSSMLVRHYGRLGKTGRDRADLYEAREQAQREITQLIRLRLRHGYELEELDGQPRLPW